MKFPSMPNVITNNFAKVKFGVQKHSPEILLVGGVAGIVTGTVLACKATPKFEAVASKTKSRLNDINEAIKNEEWCKKHDYSKEDAQRDKYIITVQGAVEAAKVYAPAVIVEGLGIAAILWSHKIMKGRNAAAIAAFVSTSAAFKKYRDNVVERYGADVDNELRYNLHNEKVTTKETDPETGKEKNVKKDVKVGEPDTNNYTMYFNKSTSTEYDEDPNYNVMFLRGRQQLCNDMFNARDHIYLNEVLDILGMEKCKSKAGQVVGWSKKSSTGDGFVDFRAQWIKRRDPETNELIDEILLDFNVDGPIIDLTFNK